MSDPTRLAKLHATGNDFLVWTQLDTGAVPVSTAVARALCDRHTGIGADGLILLGPGSDGADATMVLHNADGAIAEMSGNGIRCLAWVAAEAGVGNDALLVDTGAGRRRVVLERDDSRHVVAATVDMGPVTFEPAEIPVETASPFDLTAEFHGTTYRGDAAGMGNPHFVCFVDDVETARVTQHGPHLETDPRFPRRTNVEFVTTDGTDVLRMRVWERGVGETRSCGTGACAAAAVAHRRELVGTRVQVRVPGGDLVVDVGDTIGLGGPVVHVFDVDVDLAFLGEVGIVTVDDPGDVHVARRRQRLTATEVDLEVVRQRALLVGTGAGTLTSEAAEESLDELAMLVDTAGADPVGRELQRRDRPDPATYIGKGKAREVQELAEALDVDVVVFDDELSPAQQRNLEQLFERDVVDRVALILDIFAQHATSQEGMLQVELAQLRYRLPRLRGRGLQLSQQGAGIGTRGPGETQLEVDRRRILRRVAKLERDLDQLARTRATQRKARDRRSIPTVALVGYTNAGKSTLLNRLTDARVLVEDRLFSTLDTTTRRLRLPGGETVLCSDTVGFVRRLPHELVEAFRSTLAEVAGGDLVLHVVDGSSPDPEGEIHAVHAVMAEIGADELPELVVVNKVDVADPGTVADLVAAHPGAVAVSARTGEGVDKLLAVVGSRLRSLSPVYELLVPYDRGDVLAALHRDGEVLVEVHAEEGTRVRVRLPESVATRVAEFTMI